MPPQIATIIFAIGIIGLFVLERDRTSRPSRAIWIPVMWLLIAGSRPVSSWLHMTPSSKLADQHLEANPVNDVVFAILLVIGLVVLVKRGRQVIRLLRRNGTVLVFFLYCGISVLWSDYPGVAFRHWIRSLGDLVMVLIVLTDPNPLAAIRRLITRPAFVLVPLSVLFIKYYPELGRGYNRWTYLPSVCGVTSNKNELGVMCATLGLGSLWCFLAAYQGEEGAQRTRRLIAHGTILAMVLWLFWRANSVTSLSCFVMAGGLMALISLVRRARAPAVVHFLVGIVVCLPLFALFLDTGGSLVRSLGRDPTLTGRTVIWDVVISLSGNPLVGTGFESFWLGERLQKVWDLTMPGLQEAHNGYLEVYLNLGWIGVALLVVLIIKGYRNVFLALRRDPQVARLKLAFFVAAVVYSFTEAGFRMGSLSWISFLLVTITVVKALIPGPSYFHSVRHTGKCGECKSQVDHVFCSGFHEEAV